MFQKIKKVPRFGFFSQNDIDLRYLFQINVDFEFQGGTLGVICYKNGSNLIIDSFKAPARNIQLNGGLVNGNTLLSISNGNNRLICKYRRMVAVPSGSSDYMASLETSKYAIWGTSNNTNSGTPAQHEANANERGFSQERTTLLAVSFKMKNSCLKI